jgi:hypothetical protein
METPVTSKVLAVLMNQNDYYKGLDIPAQIARLNNLEKLLQGYTADASHCDANSPFPHQQLKELVKKSKNRLYTSITLLYELEKSVDYDALDDMVATMIKP